MKGALGIRDRWPKLDADQLDIYYLTTNANFLHLSVSRNASRGATEKLLAKNYENFLKVYRPAVRLSFKRAARDSKEPAKCGGVTAADPH